VKLSCTALNHGGSEPDQNSDSFCFGPTNAVLLYASSSEGAFQTLFQNVMRFHGHYVARDLRIFLLGVPWLSVHIVAMEDLAPTELSVVEVPAGARAVTRRVEGPGIVSPGALIKKTTPQYPATAKMQGVQGRVILDAAIGTDGHIRKLEVLGGPQALQPPALDAVRQWVYKPFLIDGEPVEVDMYIIVVFNLAG
jgi:TonB family protein